jgi:sugar lactone lactonase YvrE
LSTFAGRVPYDWARIHVDQQREETYVIYRNLVRVFNTSGMEVFSFGDDLDLGLLLDVAVDEKGDINLLSQKDSRAIVTRCNFRGEPVGSLEIKNLPSGLAFDANRMVYRNGRFYFATTAASSLIIVDGDGVFRERIEFLPLVEAEERQKVGAEMVGFAVDGEGNVFFTIPVLFKAFKYSPDGSLTSFGRPGSAPGRFGIVAGIARDSQGDVLVVDKLRCVVMVFDKDFNFLTEFGYRGARPENLIVPDDVVVDRKDRLYVTQGRMRGISVFALTRQ